MRNSLFFGHLDGSNSIDSVDSKMPAYQIVTCFPLSENQVDQIRCSVADRCRIIVSDQENIANDIFEADIFCGHAKVPIDWPEVVRRGRLKWIQSSAAGLDHCLVPSVIESEITVSGCSGLFANQVAEQTLALLTSLVRRLPVFFRAQQQKEYVRRPTDDLFGKVIGIVGFGGNGQRIAQVLRPLVDKIIATDIFWEHCQIHVDSGLADQVLPADELESLLARADVVVITLPMTPENEGLFGNQLFMLMKPGTYLINVGRGSVVDTASLIKHLEIGELAGAGIDVVEPEPLPPESPLWEMDNVIITPHVGAQSARRVPATVDLFCENLEKFFAGQPILNLVEKNLGFPRPEHRFQV